MPFLARHNASVAQRYNFLTYSVTEGLPQSQVYDLCEDSFGYLWMATEGGGLGRFDGKNFETFTYEDGLASNSVTTVLWSKQYNKLFIGTINGLSVYDGKKFTNYLPRVLEGKNVVLRLAEDGEKNIWVSTTKGGVYKWQEGTITYYHSGNGFTDRYVQGMSIVPQDGSMLFAAPGEGLYVYRNNAFSRYKPHLYDLGLSVTRLHTEADTLWAIVWREQQRFLSKSWQDSLVLYPFSDNIRNENIVYDIGRGPDQALWIATYKGILGLVKGEVNPLEPARQVAKQPTTRLFRDRENSLWIATMGEGLKLYTGSVFQYLNENDGLSNTMVTGIQRDTLGNYWMASNGGVFRYDGKQCMPEDKIAGSEIISDLLIDKKGAIWVSAEQGITRWDGNQSTLFTRKDGLYKNNHFSVYQDSKERIWWGSSGGFTVYNGKKFEMYYLPEAPQLRWVNDFLEIGPDQVLIATSYGLYKYDHGKIHAIENQHFNAKILTLVRDTIGHIWMGITDEGLIRWNPQAGQIKRYTTKDGLASHLIYQTFFDKEHNLWVGTEKGLDRLTVTREGKIIAAHHFGVNEGLTGMETNHGALLQEENGRTWIGTIDGVYIFQPGQVQHNIVPPKLSIRTVRLFHQPTQWQDFAKSTSQWFGIPQELALPYNKNHLSFEFAGISYRNPAHVKYRYKLSGFENEWSPPTTDRTAVYANLPPGSYTLWVTAANADGIWCKPIQYAFIVSPPFWQTWWFFLLSGIFVMAILVGFHQYRLKSRIRRLAHLQEIREQMSEQIRKKAARDFHDEMGNHLASISLISQVIQAKMISGESKGMNQLLNKIDHCATKLSQGTRDFIWTLDSKNDNLYQLALYLKDFGDDLFMPTQVNLHIIGLSETMRHLHLPADWNRNLILIFKEALVNTLKHSAATNVTLRFYAEAQHFEIIVQDDGKGFLVEKQAVDHGLGNMQARTAKMNGTLQISSAPGQGTVIKFLGNIPKINEVLLNENQTNVHQPTQQVLHHEDV